jgi:hypothetical protein
MPRFSLFDHRNAPSTAVQLLGTSDAEVDEPSLKVDYTSNTLTNLETFLVVGSCWDGSIYLSNNDEGPLPNYLTAREAEIYYSSSGAAEAAELQKSANQIRSYVFTRKDRNDSWSNVGGVALGLLVVNLEDDVFRERTVQGNPQTLMGYSYKFSTDRRFSPSIEAGRGWGAAGIGLGAGALLASWLDRPLVSLYKKSVQESREAAQKYNRSLLQDLSLRVVVPASHDVVTCVALQGSF